jgi:4-amino-4-deoxy-L-arabinose transferase-like glycosyltransferase
MIRNVARQLRPLHLVLVLYGMVNAAAYCCLLPLWEGFDEAYHYGYVQLLGTGLRFPVLGQARLSREIWHTFEFAPVSHYLQPFTRAPLNFTEYFALPAAERAQRRTQLESISPSERFGVQSDKPNYEVNQSPLTYVFMAGVDRLLAGSALVTRVLALRLICAILSIVLMGHVTMRLARELGLGAAMAYAAAFCVFSSQMLYATICHVSNDAVAPPAMGYVLLAAILAWKRGRNRDWAMLGVALAVALLIKAYFLFVVPLVLALIVWGGWKRRAQAKAYATVGAVGIALGAVLAGLLPAVPWYVRNLVLYHNLSATESTSGLTVSQMFKTAVAVPWVESIRYMAHSSLWTGNNSFTTFSSATLNFVLLLLAGGVVLYIVHARRDAAEWIVIAGIVFFSGGLALITVAFYLDTSGRAIAAVPWYSQVLLAPVLLIVFLGFSRAKRWGRVLAPVTIVLWAYVMAATYVVKLIPLYGGFTPAHSRVSELLRWYRSGGAESILETVCLGNWTAVKVLIVMTITMNVALCITVVVRTGFRRAQ